MSTNYRFAPGDEYVTLPRDPETWLIQPLSPVGRWLNIYGPPKKATKSYLALGMAHAISAGLDSWLSFPVHKHGPVLFLQVDTPRSRWAPRLEDLASAGWDLSNVFVADTKMSPFPFNVSEHEDILNDMIMDVWKDAQWEPAGIMYDTARKMHLGDENQSQAMQQFTYALDRVSMDMGKLLISHEHKGSNERGKDGKPIEEDNDFEGGNLMKGNRGSNAVAGGVDCVIKLTPKGWMHYQGRAVGEEHQHLEFKHAHDKAHPCPHPTPADCMGWCWAEDIDDNQAAAQKLVRMYKDGSERSLARLLQKETGIDFERARSLIRRQKKGGHE